MGNIDINLTSWEVMYLANSDFLPSTLARVFADLQRTEGGGATIQLTREDAEKCRSAFTNRLAVSGFDSDYETNAEGKVLENLIDKFWNSIVSA